jgi:hypothetical protein
MEITTGIFFTFCDVSQKQMEKIRDNSACLKKPILDRVSPVQRSNQLRYTEIVVELTRDVHV